jgi:nitrogen fixation protein NifZ
MTTPVEPGGFALDDTVVARTDLRNDGTYPDPGIPRGAILVPEGTEGQVIDIGLYLQRNIVYAVRFANGRLVGSLARELAPVPGTTDGSASGTTDDGATDDGATDDGATDDGATDDGATDDKERSR